ncbi:DUF1380 family protein [Pantoea agglomerans]|uniref:DUF1380 family protein n=1 Tax=Enterobacter agglomerans TaxID=549 RepID=UPI00045C9175|nr:DUF1380 family protein [Pantoea agglomerans]KDA94303.1 hypothetical protein T296_11545 [Pantoea agglomerans Eh318]
MYGTVSQLCNRLKAQFEGDQKITLIIWRKEDVMRVMGEEHVTGEIVPFSDPEVLCVARQNAVSPGVLARCHAAHRAGRPSLPCGFPSLTQLLQPAVAGAFTGHERPWPLRTGPA